MAISAKKYLKLAGDKGLTILLPVDEIGPVLYEYRKATNHKAAGHAIYVMLPNNNRIEVIGETVESLLKKVGEAQGWDLIVYDGPDTVPLTELEPQPEPESQTDA